LLRAGLERAMSKEHAKKFVEHMERDETLRRKVREASEHIIKVAKDHGYEVTREDLKSVFKERWTTETDDEAGPAVLSELPRF
jgi:predicted ribosomally synthesized peptide with nif11-like leader